jgi:dTDP-4-dehydrorhamnose reductase
MKVAGSGLSGLIGTRFQELHGGDHEITNLDLSTGIDITNETQVVEAIKNSGASVLLHLAAFTNVSAAHEQQGDDEGSCYRVNVVGTENMVKAARETGAYLIHISTDYVFDGTKETPYTEEDETNPIEWYGKTKLLAEERVINGLERWAILRLAFPYQARPMRPDFLANMIEKLSTNTLPPAFTDHTITPTFVDDLVGVFDYFVRNNPSGIYHTVGSSWHTDLEVATMVKQIFELPGEVSEGSLEAYLKTTDRPYQKSMRVSNQKMLKETGLQMATLEEGLLSVRQQLAQEPASSI